MSEGSPSIKPGIHTPIGDHEITFAGKSPVEGGQECSDKKEIMFFILVVALAAVSVATQRGTLADGLLFLMGKDSPQSRRSLLASGQENPLQWKIVFDSERDGNSEIYAMDPDGSNQQRLTHDKSSDRTPAWSPDGKKVAFASDREGHSEIFVMDPDGSNQQRLTRTAGKDSVNPAWSPDGRKIAFESNRDGNWEIYVMNAEGVNVQRLTHTKGKAKSSENPDWAPDGKRIAFDSNRDDKREIYVMDADGSNLRWLTQAPGKTLGGEHPNWSPDGKRIAFDSTWGRTSKKWHEVTEIYVIDSDGSNVQRLSNTTGIGNLTPVWAPDGKRMVFMSTRDWRSEKWPRSAELYVMDADGSNARRLTFNKAFDAHPDW